MIEQRVPKETSHRGDELKALGWTAQDVSRYVELWEYRQRWGAMNLEREDRLFLKSGKCPSRDRHRQGRRQETHAGQDLLQVAELPP